MGLLLFFSCILITYAPALALFVLVLSRSAQLIILAMGSAFFWLLSILVSSILWSLVPPLKTAFYFVIPFAVFFQEIVRWFFWKLYDRGYNHGAFASDSSKPSNFTASLAVGWGIGVASALILYTSVVWHGRGPGFLPANACPHISLFYISAVIALQFVLLHMMLSVIAFDAFARCSYKWIAFVVGAHLAASFFTLINQRGGSCLWSVLLTIGVNVVVALALSRTIRSFTSSVQFQKIN